METARPVFSLVIPVYRNLGSLPELLRQVGALAERLPGALELVMVVDASPDGSYGYLLEHLPRQAFDSQLLLLARTSRAAAFFGRQRALWRGNNAPRKQHRSQRRQQQGS